MLLAIRVDAIITSPIVGYIKSISPVWLLGVEGKDMNPHIHFYVDTEIPLATLRNHMRKEGLQGNKSYSITQVKDKIKYCAYIIKDGNYYYSDTFPKDLINDAMAYKETIQSDQSRKKSTNISKEIDIYFTKCVADFQELPPTAGTGTMHIAKMLYKRALEWHVEQALPIRVNCIEVYVNTWMCKNRPYYSELLAQKFFERYSSW